MARGGGRGTKGKGRASAIPSMDNNAACDDPPPSQAAPPTKKVSILWEKTHSARTSRLIAWCNANEDARIKLFSDSSKEAKEQGRKKKQSGVSRDAYYLQLADAIFSIDEDPGVRQLFQNDPKAFIKPVQSRFGT